MPTELIRYTEYNPNTCTVNTTGQWTVTSPPANGATSQQIVSGPPPNGLCPGAIWNWTALFYTWTSTKQSAKSDSLSATWSTPNFSFPFTFNLAIANVAIDQVQLNDASSVEGYARVTINAPADAPVGPLTFNFTGRSALSTQTTTSTYAPGASQYVKLVRPVIAKGVYDKVSVTWNIASAPVPATYSPPANWDVLGRVRYTQYNTPN